MTRVARRTTALLAALLLVPFASLQAAVDEDQLLPVEEAFAVSAQAGADGQLRLTWRIADGYYLYRHRLAAASSDDGVEVGPLQLPPGTAYTDEFFGEVETYRGDLAAQAALTRPPGVDQATVEVRFQGCADVGVCYPPHRQLLTVALPAMAAAGGGVAGLAALVPAQAQAPVAADNPLARALGGAPAPAPLQDAVPAQREPPLPEDQAFVFEAIALAPTQVLARFTMPRGYYLYRDQTAFALPPGEATMARPDWPAAAAHQDEHFGEVAVFFDQVEVPITVAATDAGSATATTLEASFQGCQLDGICYPPMTRRVELLLPPAGAEDLAAARAAIAAAPYVAPVLSEPRTANADSGDGGASGANAAPSAAQAGGAQDRADPAAPTDGLAGLVGGGGWLTLGGFFLAGLLLAFTPCVLPMVPILSGLIAGAGTISTRRAFVLSLVYVLATAVVFTGAGVVAGLAGQNLQALFQKPWILITFAALFVVLAFSMFGFYELQLPARWQTRLAQVSNRQHGGSLTGVAVMGMLSALIVGPCVAPPLAAAVTYIGQTGDPVLGGAALFALAMGMGTPLLVIGTGAGRWLPRAGAWMDTVKAVFGVAFLFLAWWMLERILPPALTLALLGALLIGCGVYLGALQRLPDNAHGWRKLWQAAGLVLLVLGGAQLVGALAGGDDYLRPLARVGAGAGTGPQAAAPAQFRMVKTGAELDAALDQAHAAGQTALFDFYADWCVECKRMERYTFPEPPVQQALDNVVMLKVDVTDQTDGDVGLQQRFGIIGPPATLFFRETNERRPLRLIGFEDAEGFAQRIERAKVPCEIEAC
jgi:thiol:disulfide interchange protein DsbD